MRLYSAMARLILKCVKSQPAVHIGAAVFGSPSSWAHPSTALRQQPRKRGAFLNVLGKWGKRNKASVFLTLLHHSTRLSCSGVLHAARQITFYLAFPVDQRMASSPAGAWGTGNHWVPSNFTSFRVWLLKSWLKLEQQEVGLGHQLLAPPPPTPRLVGVCLSAAVRFDQIAHCQGG